MIRRQSTSRFLFFAFPPCEIGLWGMLSLRQCATLAACADVVLALIATAAVLSLLPEYLLIDVHKPSVDTGLLILALPFALLGLSGLNQLHRAKVELYSYFKHFEFFIVLLLSVRAVMEVAKKWEHSWVAYGFYAGRVVVDFGVLYMVWSCSTRLKNGEETSLTRSSFEDSPLKPSQTLAKYTP